MRKIRNLDLIVQDVPAAAAFFHDVVDLYLRVNEPNFAELDAGAVDILLTAASLVAIKPAAGVVLHFQVDDVAQALEAARSKGARVLLEPTLTDRGTESAMIAGPENIVVSFDRWVGAIRADTP